MIKVNNDTLFELYSTFMAIGYTKMAKGKTYPRKDKIERLIKNCEISTINMDNERYLTIDDVRKVITVSNCEKKMEFVSWLKHNNYVSFNEVFNSERKETIFFDRLIKILKPMNYSVLTQYQDNNYRLDGYVKEIGLVIEYDENNHDHYDDNDEYDREQYIKNHYKFLMRVNDLHDIYYNIGLVMNKVFEIKQISKFCS